MSDGGRRCLRAFVEELVRGRRPRAVVCPGSRSTPLALALAAHDGLRVRVLLDERSAAFFALGMARASAPAGRRCWSTSGTAAAEFRPAVVEASLARVPLVRADRGPARSSCATGAPPQTIDQAHLYGAPRKLVQRAAAARRRTRPPRPTCAGWRPGGRGRGAAGAVPGRSTSTPRSGSRSCPTGRSGRGRSSAIERAVLRAP